MQVTVYDRVPTTAEISVAQVESYLRRTGWRLDDEGDDFACEWSLEVPGCHVVYTGEGVADSLWVQIEIVARAESRQPSAVLADIAKEPT